MGKAAHQVRIAVAVAAVALVAVGMTGCSSGGGSDVSNTVAAEKTAHDTQPITYWSMYNKGEAQQKVIAEAISAFEKKTGITVDVQWMGRTNTQKLIPALNTNNVPDIIDGSYANLYASLAATGQALDLTRAYNTKVNGDKTVKDVIPAKYLKGADLDNKDGQPWMLPYSLTTEAFWFNPAKYPQLVTDPPKTWSAFTALLKKYKAKGITPIAADGDISGYDEAYFVDALLGEEGPGAFKKLASEKNGAGWDSPAVLKAATMVYDLAKGGDFISGYDASKWPAQEEKWANNQAALIFNGSWIPTETGPFAAKGFQYDSFPFPSIDPKDNSVRADYIGFAIPKKAKNHAEAEEFAAFMLNLKNQDALGTQAEILPMRADAQTAPVLASVKTMVDQATSYHQANDGVDFPGYEQKVFGTPDTALFFGQITPKKFVQEMKANQIAYWKSQS